VPRWPAARTAAGLGLLGVLAVNVANAPFGPPSGQLARSEEVARSIAAAAGGSPFSLWLVAADGDSDGAYRFQLERLGHPPVDPAQALAHQLFVVCQASTTTACDLHAVRASAGPEWAASQSDWESQVADVRITRLVLPE
jgi:hypothetical protein